MGLIERILAGAGVESRQATGTLAEPADWLWDAFGASTTYTGRGVTPESALQLIPVWAAVSLIAGSVGSLPLMVYRGLGREKARAPDAFQYGVLHDEPNDEEAADVVWEYVAASLL